MTLCICIYAITIGYVFSLFDQQSESDKFTFNIKRLFIAFLWPIALATILSSYIAIKTIGDSDNDEL